MHWVGSVEWLRSCVKSLDGWFACGGCGDFNVTRCGESRRNSVVVGVISSVMFMVVMRSLVTRIVYNSNDIVIRTSPI